MSFLRKSKPSPDDGQFQGRRRPLARQDPAIRETPPRAMFSYHSQRSNAESNLGRRETIETVQAGRGSLFGTLSRNRALGVAAAIACLVIVAASSVLRADPQVVLLEDDTTAYFLQDSEIYRRTAEASLKKSVFNTNKLTVDTANVRTELLKHHPEVKNVSVQLPIIGTRPRVYIEPFKPSFILATTSSNAYVLDATGRALANTNQIADVENLGLPTLQDKTGVDVELGNRAIPSTTVTFVQTVVAALKAKNIEPSTLSLPAGAYQLDVAIAGQPYFVKFNLQNDALQQAGTYLAVQNRLKNEKVTPGQYIDVRVPDRAYYK